VNIFKGGLESKNTKGQMKTKRRKGRTRTMIHDAESRRKKRTGGGI